MPMPVKRNKDYVASNKGSQIQYTHFRSVLVKAARETLDVVGLKISIGGKLVGVKSAC